MVQWRSCRPLPVGLGACTANGPLPGQYVTHQSAAQVTCPREALLGHPATSRCLVQRHVALHLLLCCRYSGSSPSQPENILKLYD